MCSVESTSLNRKSLKDLVQIITILSSKPVLLRGEQDYWTVKREMAETAFDVLLETDILVSPHSIWLDEWENPEGCSNPALLESINKEGIRL